MKLVICTTGVMGIGFLCLLLWQSRFFRDTKLYRDSQKEEKPIIEHRFGLNPLRNSNESGIAIMKERGGYTVITLRLVGFPLGVIQPAYIHEGTCQALGKKKYYVTPLYEGESDTTYYEMSLTNLARELPLALVVGTFSCGDIQL